MSSLIWVIFWYRLSISLSSILSIIALIFSLTMGFASIGLGAGIVRIAWITEE